MWLTVAHPIGIVSHALIVGLGRKLQLAAQRGLSVLLTIQPEITTALGLLSNYGVYIKANLSVITSNLSVIDIKHVNKMDGT